MEAVSSLALVFSTKHFGQHGVLQTIAYGTRFSTAQSGLREVSRPTPTKARRRRRRDLRCGQSSGEDAALQPHVRCRQTRSLDVRALTRLQQPVLFALFLKNVKKKKEKS